MSAAPSALNTNRSTEKRFWAPAELENPPFSLYIVWLRHWSGKARVKHVISIADLRSTWSKSVDAIYMFMSMELTARVRLAKDVLMQKVGDDAILLNLNTENYFTLDEVGTRIIDTLQESDSVTQAVRKLVGIYEVDEGKLTKDAVRLVEECEQHGLLQITEA